MLRTVIEETTVHYPCINTVNIVYIYCSRMTPAPPQSTTVCGSLVPRRMGGIKALIIEMYIHVQCTFCDLCFCLLHFIILSSVQVVPWKLS